VCFFTKNLADRYSRSPWDSLVERPEIACKCCLAFHYIDLEKPSTGWKALPLPSYEHFSDQVSFWAEGSMLRIGYGTTKEMGCPCCGYCYTHNPMQHALDLLCAPLVWREIGRTANEVDDIDRHDDTVVAPLDGGACLRVINEYTFSPDGDIQKHKEEHWVSVDTQYGSLRLADFEPKMDAAERDVAERAVAVKRRGAAMAVYDALNV